MDEDEGQRVVELFRYLTYEEDTSRLRWQSHMGDQDEQHLKLPSHDQKTTTANCTIRTSNPDIALLALCQFAATRLDAEVVGISLLGRHGQYILAQSTQSLELHGAASDKESQDGEWLDITQGHWHYNLCQKSIHTQAKDSAEVPLHGISDFSLDAGLGTLSCLKGPPFLRSFWSTPVRTAKRYNIGVLWLLDDKVRQEPRNGQMRFMRAITSLVMRELESRKESIEHQKVLRVVQAIDYLIDGAQENHDARNWNLSAHDASKAPAHLHSLDASNQSKGDVQAQLQDGSSSHAHTPTVTERSQVVKRTREESIVVSKPETSANEEMMDSKDKHDRDLVYARASYLIRDSLAMQGCVFFDTSAGFLV
ncbi:hypothetical protein GJ744_012325 [Endocarpon pusillum]|uniref:GAF domain-containing protein n=1 Tax=Endocarpon pusillum TaxID=364733 RepID=A0A8H7E2R3_9EURO|nr:hypothetical protein GJ744_012325 [Endocarpon pusillum]